MRTGWAVLIFARDGKIRRSAGMAASGVGSGSNNLRAVPVWSPWFRSLRPTGRRVWRSWIGLIPLAAGLVSKSEGNGAINRHDGRCRSVPYSRLQLEENKAASDHCGAQSSNSPATASLAVALVRDTHNDDSNELTGMAEARLATYRRWHKTGCMKVAAGFPCLQATPQGLASPRGSQDGSSQWRLSDNATADVRLTLGQRSPDHAYHARRRTVATAG
jgi:hypothetical protein